MVPTVRAQTKRMNEAATANAPIITAWNGVLFDKWVDFRALVDDELAIHSDALLRRRPVTEGDRVLDVGCGLGATSRTLADRVGPRGQVAGVDAAPRFVATAKAETPGRFDDRLRFFEADVQVADLGGPYDYVFSRFGTMFFTNPVAAFRNMAAALRPGGQLGFVAWRRRQDNPWLHDAERIVREFLQEPEHTDEPTCGPGPFSLQSADFIRTILAHGDFAEVKVERFDQSIAIGRDLDEAVRFAMSLGPAGEIVRLCGEEGERLRPTIEAKLRGHFASLPRTERGLIQATSSVWLVTAVRAWGSTSGAPVPRRPALPMTPEFCPNARRGGRTVASDTDVPSPITPSLDATAAPSDTSACLKRSMPTICPRSRRWLSPRDKIAAPGRLTAADCQPARALPPIDPPASDERMRNRKLGIVIEAQACGDCAWW